MKEKDRAEKLSREILGEMPKGIPLCPKKRGREEGNTQGHTFMSKEHGREEGNDGR